MPHAELACVAEGWLRGSRRCRVVLLEKGCGSEICDAIGWGINGSIVVECKTSRADFFADLRKPHRHPAAVSLGRERWYLTLPGLLRPDELPPRWGLLEWTGRICRRRVKPAICGQTYENQRGELAVLLYELAAYQAQGITYDVFRGRTGKAVAKDREAPSLASDSLSNEGKPNSLNTLDRP